MTLHRYDFQSYAMNVRDAAMLHEPGLYDLDAPYQRGSVWTDEQRENLIRSLLEGIPCGIVYRNFKGFNKPVPYVIVDGKQRIETIRAFYAGDLTVPASWFDRELLGREVYHSGTKSVAELKAARVSYRDLSAQGQRHFDMAGLSVYETRLPDTAAEKVLFDRINFGGTPHPMPSDAYADGWPRRSPRPVVDAQTGKLKA